jgi:hypothetical protein
LFSVGKADAILQVSPTALRFWEKLGLGPRGGKKNVTAFALFEDNGEERKQQVERWLRDMSRTYSVRNYLVHYRLPLTCMSATGTTLRCACRRTVQQLPKRWHCSSEVRRLSQKSR